MFTAVKQTHGQIVLQGNFKIYKYKTERSWSGGTTVLVHFYLYVCMYVPKYMHTMTDVSKKGGVERRPEFNICLFVILLYKKMRKIEYWTSQGRPNSYLV